MNHNKREIVSIEYFKHVRSASDNQSGFITINLAPSECGPDADLGIVVRYKFQCEKYAAVILPDGSIYYVHLSGYDTALNQIRYHCTKANDQYTERIKKAIGKFLAKQ